VHNFGAGIPEGFRSTIFQPFSQADNSNTRERGGTGLGLNISRHLVEAMGGTIGFESEPNEETVFWFTCPLA
jgi:signal transduction histidine kinase